MSKKIFLINLLFLLALVPLAASAQSLGFPCNLDNAFTDCTFDKIFGLYNTGGSMFSRLYNFIVFYLAVPLATISIVVAGIMYATSSVDPGRRSKAKTILTYAVIGLIITLASYLIVKTIVNALAEDNAVGNAIKLN